MALVQNFELHGIIKNCYKNKGFIYFSLDGVKNNEPSYQIAALKHSVAKMAT